MDFESDRKRKRDGEGSAAAQSVGVADTGSAHAPSQLSLMAEMKAALDSNTSQIVQLQIKVDELQNRLDSSEEKRQLLEDRCSFLERAAHKDWKYSAKPIPSSYCHKHGYDEYDIKTFCEDIKDETCRLRDCSIKMERRDYVWLGGDTLDVVPYDDKMLPHWREFTDALQLYHHSEPMDSFKITDIQLSSDITDMMVPALRGKRIQGLELENNDFADYIEGAKFVKQLIEQNPTLLKEFTWKNNQLERESLQVLATALGQLRNIESITIEDGIESDSHGMLDIFLPIFMRSETLKKIAFASNGISTEDGTSSLLDFLTVNTTLEELSLSDNYLADEDALILSNGLKENTTLQGLNLSRNEIGDIGCGAFADALCQNNTLRCLNLAQNDITTASEGYKAMQNAVYNSTSLNALADSNNACEVNGIYTPCMNLRELTLVANMKNKVYSLLATRNVKGSNVYHLNLELGDDSLKLAPRVLAIPAFMPAHIAVRNDLARPLSVMYELLRNWKMPALYESRSTQC